MPSNPPWASCYDLHSIPYTSYTVFARTLLPEIILSVNSSSWQYRLSCFLPLSKYLRITHVHREKPCISSSATNSFRITCLPSSSRAVSSSSLLSTGSPAPQADPGAQPHFDCDRAMPERRFLVKGTLNLTSEISNWISKDKFLLYRKFSLCKDQHWEFYFDLGCNWFFFKTLE